MSHVPISQALRNNNHFRSQPALANIPAAGIPTLPRPAPQVFAQLRRVTQHLEIDSDVDLATECRLAEAYLAQMTAANQPIPGGANQLGQILAALNGLQHSVTALDQRITALDQRITAMDRRLNDFQDRVEARLIEIQGTVSALDRRVLVQEVRATNKRALDSGRQLEPVPSLRPDNMGLHPPQAAVEHRVISDPHQLGVMDGPTLAMWWEWLGVPGLAPRALDMRRDALWRYYSGQ